MYRFVPQAKKPNTQNISQLGTQKVYTLDIISIDIYYETVELEEINPVKKRRLLYLKTQSVPHCEHFSSRL